MLNGDADGINNIDHDSLGASTNNVVTLIEKIEGKFDTQ